MNRIPHDIHRSNWLDILKRNQQRPAHTTTKQWCLGNDILEKSYYYFQRKSRQKAARQVPVLATTNSAPVTYAEIPSAYKDAPSDPATTNAVDVVNALISSISETVKLNGLHPHYYLQYILT